MNLNSFSFIIWLLLPPLVNTCKQEQRKICQESVSSDYYSRLNDHPHHSNEEFPMSVGTCINKHYSTFTHLCLNNDHSTQELFCCCITTNNNNKKINDTHEQGKLDSNNDIRHTFPSLLCCTYQQASNIFRCESSRDQVAIITPSRVASLTTLASIFVSVLAAVVLLVVGVLMCRKVLKAWSRKKPSLISCCEHASDLNNKCSSSNNNNNKNNNNNNVKASIDRIQNINNDHKNHKNLLHCNANQQGNNCCLSQPPAYSPPSSPAFLNQALHNHSLSFQTFFHNHYDDHNNNNNFNKNNNIINKNNNMLKNNNYNNNSNKFFIEPSAPSYEQLQQQ